MIKILNFSGKPILNVKRGFLVVNLDLAEISEGVSPARLPILSILQALDKGRADVVVGNFALVLPDNPFLAAGIALAFSTLNKYAPVVAKVKPKEDGLEIEGFADFSEIVREVAVIREKIWAEYRKFTQSKSVLA